MEGVNGSLKTSLDSLTTPRLTLSELDDTIKVGMHVTCRFVFIADWNSCSVSQNNNGTQFKSVKLTGTIEARSGDRIFQFPSSCGGTTHIWLFKFKCNDLK